MRISIGRGNPFAIPAHILAFCVTEEDFQQATKGLPSLLSARAREAAAPAEFTGKAGQSMLMTSAKTEGEGCAEYVAVIGLGAKATLSRERVRDAVGVALGMGKQLRAREVALVWRNREAELSTTAVGQAIAEAALHFSYAYVTYRKPGHAVASLTVVADDARQAGKLEKGVARGETVMRGVSLARDLVNAPPQDMHPEELARVAKEIATSSHGRITAKVLEQAACEKLGMQAYLAVARGSVFPPKFLHLTYTPEAKSKKTLAVVGKGVTFDSGGLSLKPADAMVTMKCDMAGAAAVLGFFSVLAALAPRVTVHGIIAACENMPSGAAMRPGDIVRSAQGKTIEVINTDAEGRLTLADALDYAVKLKPDVVLDLATLTGACVVALGEEVAGVMANNEQLAVRVLAAAERAGEKLWELPLEKRYHALIESDVADLRNLSTSRYGGSLTAGLFLQEFVGDVPWAHLDIAGPAFAERPMASYIGKGGTGYGVRTLVEFLETHK